MAKKITIKPRESEPQVTINYQGQEGKVNSLDKAKSDASWFQYYENMVVNDDRFKESDEEGQKHYLGNLFDEHGSKMVLEGDRNNPEKYNALREDYINGTFNKLKSGDTKELFTEPLGVEPPTIKADSTVSLQDAATATPLEKSKRQQRREDRQAGKTPGSVQEIAEYDIMDDLYNRVEATYAERNWPSPNKKMTEFNSGLNALQLNYQAGNINEDEFQQQADELVNRLGLIRDGDNVIIPKNDAELYADQLDRTYKKIMQEQAELAKEPYIKDLYDALGIGAARVMTAPSRLLAMSEELGNGMLALIGQKENWGSTYWKDKANAERYMLNKWSESNQRYDKSITEYIKAGDYGKALGQTMLSVAENAPMLATLAVGNAAGLTNLSLAFMGFDKGADEFLESEGDPNMNTYERWVDFFTKSGSEIVFENMGTISILNSVKEGIAKAGAQTVKDQMVSAYTPFLEKLVNLATTGVTDAGIEAAEEMATQLTDNLMNKALGKDVGIMDGVGDAGIVGAVMGNMIALPQMIAEANLTKSDYAKDVMSRIPQYLDTHSKVEFTNLLIEGDLLNHEKSKSPETFSEQQTIKLNDISERIGQLINAPTYSIAGFPLTAADVLEIIDRTQDVSDLNGLEVTNDPIMEAYIMEKFTDNPTYSFKGNPISKANAVDLINNAKDVSEIEGLTVSNDNDVETMLSEKFAVEPINANYEEWIAEERAIYDTKIKEAQKRLGLPTTPNINIPDAVEETLDKIERGEPVINQRLKETSDILYEEYKRLDAMIQSDTRQYTTEQIQSMQEVLGEEIETLNNLINEQANKGEFQTKEVELTDEVKVSQITEKGEGSNIKPSDEKAKVAVKVTKPLTALRQELADMKDRLDRGSKDEGLPRQIAEWEAEIALQEKMGLGENEGREQLEAIPEETKPEQTDIKPKEEPKKESTYGNPKEVTKSNIGTFANTYNAEITALQNQLSSFQGRPTTETLNAKREIEGKIAQKESELKDYLSEAQPQLEQAIDELMPEADQDTKDEIMGRLWEAMIEPTPKQSKQTIGDVLLDIIGSREQAEIIPEETKPEPRELTDKEKEQLNDSLVLKMREYNSTPKSHSKKRSSIYRDIMNRIPLLGYTLEYERNNIVILNQNGSKIKMTAIKGDYKTINDYDSEFATFAKEFLANPTNAIGLDIPGVYGKNIQKAVEDVLNERRNNNSNQLLQELNDMFINGVLKFRQTQNTPSLHLSINDWRNIDATNRIEDFTTANGELTISNIDIAIEEGIITPEEGNEIKNILRDELENQQLTEEEYWRLRSKEIIGEEPVSDSKGKGGDKGQTEEVISIEGTPQQKQIDELLIEQKSLEKRKANLSKEFNNRNGLFGDTDSDLFGEESALKQEDFNRAMKQIEDRLIEIDRKIKELRKNAETGIRESKKQIEIKDDKGSIKEDLDELDSLLDDIDFDEGISMASGGEGGIDARTKALNTATKIIGKMIDSGAYSFEDIMSQLLPVTKIDQLKRLLPFLKQGHSSYWSTAPTEIADKMNIMDTRSFDEGALESLLAKMNSSEKPNSSSDIEGKTFFIPQLNKFIQVIRVEEWDNPSDQHIESMGGIFAEFPKEYDKITVAVLSDQTGVGGQKYGVDIINLREAIKSGEIIEKPQYDNPEYRKGLQRVIDIYNSIGMTDEASKLELMKYREPKFPFTPNKTWKEYLEDLEKSAEAHKIKEDILSGKVMFDPLPAPKEISEEDVLDYIESLVERGDPLYDFIKKYTPKELINKVVELENQSRKLIAKLGFTPEGLREVYYLKNKYLVSGSSTSLYPIGTKARAYEKGYEGASIEKVKNAIEYLRNNIAKDEKALQKAREAAFTWEIKNHILNAKVLDNWLDVVRIAKKWDITNKGAIRDQYELAMVEIARTIAQNQNISIEDKWTQILNLYKTQPGISETARTNEVKELQQYSTPTPLGLLMGEYVNAQQASYILEPSAGMGALLINANRKGVRANDIDERRINGLQEQGYRVIAEDSSKGLSKFLDVQQFPAILMNPPFGGMKEEYAGFPLTGEYVHVAHNLEQLSPTGKAAIIVGGHIEFKPNGQMKGKDLYFFNWLNKHFNVEDVIQIPGEFYKKMGAKYPIKLILINGRKPTPEGAAPLYSDMFDPISEWGELKDRILNLTTKPDGKNILQSKVDAQRGDDNIMGSTPTVNNPNQPDTRPDAVISGETPTATIGRVRGDEGVPDRDETRPDPGDGRRRTDTANNKPPVLPKSNGGTNEEDRKSSPRLRFGEIQTKRNPEDLPVNNIGKPNERTKRELGLTERTGDEVTPYVPLSGIGSGNYVVPASIANEVETALMWLRGEVGDVDQYVMRKLGYNSIDEMKSAFFAEQVDGIAQSIYNIENNNGMIIGHQTGTGKGRMSAAVIRYAIENGKLPVFVTKSADLFSDMYRDLIDIGSPNYKPFMMNQQFASSGQKVRIFHPETGEVLHEVDATENAKVIGTPSSPGTGILPEGTQMVFTTYSQFTTKNRDANKREFLMNLARNKDVVFIMDESHDASGQSSTGEFFMDWIQQTQGGVFLSATYAKRPDNMPLYASKTVLREANMNWDQLIEAIQQGGGALQEMITLQLAEAGQFSKVGFRMDAEMNYLIIGDNDSTQRTHNPEAGQRMIAQYDGVTEIIKDIINFQEEYVNPVLETMNEEVKREGRQVGGRKGTSQAGISNTPYFSRVWNILDQLIVAIKVKETLPLIIQDLQRGIKPVIALKSTMESVFFDMYQNKELLKGETINLDFSTILMRGMDTVMKYTKTNEAGIDEKAVLSLEDLTTSGRSKYLDLIEKIQKTSTGIPLSPIDILRKGIEDAGFESIEITGRSTMFKMNKDLTKGEFTTNNRGDKIKALRKFNNNPGVAAIINRAGSTGISMHSSGRFQDTSQRSMYILQNDLDINVVVQILGRVYRADQLNKPIYNILTSTLPAEKRMFMMNARKLKSLDANTSGNQKQSKNIVDVPDFLNKYGDDVVIEFLRENPDINYMIGDPCDVNSDEPKRQGAAHKVTYRLQILPSQLQDEVNKDLIDRYERYIEYLNSVGRNDLMVTSENLNAVVKETEVAVQGHGGYSMFGDDTILNTIEADVTRKPYTKKEIEEELAKIPANHNEDIRRNMEAGMLNNLNKNVEKITKDYEEIRLSWKKKIESKEGLSPQEKEREYQLKVDEINQREEERLEAVRLANEANKNLFEEYLDSFEPGQVLYVPFSDTEQLDTVRTNYGIFLGFSVNMNKSNPWVPSNFVMKFATTDSRRIAHIAASKSNHIGAILHNSRRIATATAREVRENWDKYQTGKQREIRYVVTNNILQGMNIYSKGRLITFSKADGSVDRGILMPENWIKPEDRIARIPISKSIDIIHNLAPGSFVESIGGDIIIKKLSRNAPEQFYELRVPATSKRGDKYYSNEQLKNSVIDGYFEQHGDRMVAQFTESQLQEVLNILEERFKITLEVDSKEVQQSTNATEAHEVMDSFGQKRPTKAKIRKGLSNPHNDTIGTEEKIVGNRIQPAPITGEKPKKMWDIQYDLTEALGRKLRYARKPGARKSAIGTYYPGTGRVVIRWHADLNTTAHEFGHSLDDAFGLLGPEAQSIWGDLKSELSQLWEYGSTPPKGHPNPDQYRMMEGMAEFIRAFLVNPHETQKRFPITYEWVKGRLTQDPQAWEGLKQFSNDIRIWWGSSAGDQIMSKIYMGIPEQEQISYFRRENEKGQFQLTEFDRWARKYTNFFRPIEQMYRWALGKQGIDIDKLSPTENWEMLNRLLLGEGVKLRSAFEHGLVDFQGNRIIDQETGQPLSFHLMLSQIPNHIWADMETNLQEAIKYGMAERIVEIPWKFQARQIRMDLAVKGDYLPPPHILNRHPFIIEQYEAKINDIYKRLNEGELNPEDVFLPEERYDFTESVIAGIAQEGMTDYNIALSAVEEYKTMERTNPEKYKWIHEFNRIYREIGRNVMMYARDSGLLSNAGFEQIDNENLSYMAMKRLFVMDPAEIVEGKIHDSMSFTEPGQADSRGLVKLVIHPIKGSQKEIKNPIEALMEAYAQVVRNGDLNYSIMKFASAFNGNNRDLYMDKPIKVGELAWVSKAPEQRSISFFVKGKRRYLVIPDPELFAAFKNMAPKRGADSNVLKALSYMPQMLRNSITMAPVFALRNIMRDFKHFLGVGSSIKHLRLQDFLPNKKMREAFDATGAGQFGYLTASKRGYYELLRMAMFKVSEDPKKWIVGQNLIENAPDKKYLLPFLMPKALRVKAGPALQNIYESTFGVMMSGEKVVRMLQFKAAVREGTEKYGLTEQEAIIRAAFKARDLMDFMVGGEVVMEWNKVVVFLNPAIRGLDRLYRSIKDPKQREGVLARMVLLFALPGIMNSLLIAMFADDEEKQEYLSAPDYERDMFFRIPAGKGWILMPRPFELGAITAIFQRATDKIVLGDENAFSPEFFKSIAHMITPVDAAGVFGGYSGVIAALFNYDFFRQKHIIPPDEVGISIVSRNTDYASKFGQLMMKASDLTTLEKNHYRIDARKVDAFIQGQFSYYGNFFLNMTEMILPGESNNKYKFDLSSTGFYRYANAYAEPNTQWLLSKFKNHSWLKNEASADYTIFNNYLRAYFGDEAQQSIDRRKEIGKALREYSANKRKEWKDVDFYREDLARKQINDIKNSANQ